jgi:ABC-type ATPase involved in cell division
MADSLTYLGRTQWRDDRRAFGIHAQDRLAHMYVVGKTGTGKSSMVEFLVRQDLANRLGLAVFDPHGGLVERVHSWAISHGRTDVIDLDKNSRFPTHQFVRRFDS